MARGVVVNVVGGATVVRSASVASAVVELSSSIRPEDVVNAAVSDVVDVDGSTATALSSTTNEEAAESMDSAADSGVIVGSVVVGSGSLDASSDTIVLSATTTGVAASGSVGAGSVAAWTEVCGVSGEVGMVTTGTAWATPGLESGVSGETTGTGRASVTGMATASEVMGDVISGTASALGSGSGVVVMSGTTGTATAWTTASDSVITGTGTASATGIATALGAFGEAILGTGSARALGSGSPSLLRDIVGDCTIGTSTACAIEPEDRDIVGTGTTGTGTALATKGFCRGICMSYPSNPWNAPRDSKCCTGGEWAGGPLLNVRAP